MFHKEFSVVLVAKNEERRIRESLQSIQLLNPSEIIVVDGNSEDDTVAIAREFATKIIVSKDGNLTKDRQLGIDQADFDYIVMIDADHRVRPNTVDCLFNDMNKYNLDIIQAQLRFLGSSFLCEAENQLMEITTNVPGEKQMIGVAPALYKKAVFREIKFDDHITKSMDDTDLMYRLKRDTTLRIGTAAVVVSSLHFGGLQDYFQKFLWYGKGDGEFCIKHKKRAWKMLIHLIITYPFLYPIKGILTMKFKLIPFCVFQGWVRLFACVRQMLRP